MATKEVRRPTMRPESSVYTRPVGVSSKTVCAYWIAGRCTKKFCRFLHTSAPSSLANPHISKQKAIQKGNAYNATQKSNVVQKFPEKVCKFWVVGNCVEGDRCPYLHTWFRGAGFSMLVKLQGHKKVLLISKINVFNLFCSLFSFHKKLEKLKRLRGKIILAITFCILSMLLCNLYYCW